MSSRVAALPLAAPRPWVVPTLTEHGPLASLAHATAGVVPTVVALLQIGISCTTNPAGCQ